MKVGEFLQSKYLTVSDLNGQSVTGHIIEAGAEVLRDHTGTTTRKLALRIEGIGKPLIVNRTSLKILAHSFGSETDEWVGKQVVVSSVIGLVFNQPQLMLSIQPSSK